MNIDAMKKLVIVPVLQDLELYSWNSQQLIAAIYAHESKCGKYLNQIGYDGPNQGLGPYAIQAGTVIAISTYFDRKIYKEKSKQHKVWWDKVQEYRYYNESLSNNLKYNFQYSTAICRLFFVRFEEEIPDFHDIVAIAKYWKKYYNTEAGKGTVEKFINDWVESDETGERRMHELHK